MTAIGEATPSTCFAVVEVNFSKNRTWSFPTHPVIRNIVTDNRVHFSDKCMEAKCCILNFFNPKTTRSSSVIVHVTVTLIGRCTTLMQLQLWTHKIPKHCKICVDLDVHIHAARTYLANKCGRFG